MIALHCLERVSVPKDFRTATDVLLHKKDIPVLNFSLHYREAYEKYSSFHLTQVLLLPP